MRWWLPSFYPTGWHVSDKLVYMICAFQPFAILNILASGAWPSNSIVYLSCIGPRPSELYGKFTWRIDNFSQINKRELRSNSFDVGGFKWYGLIAINWIISFLDFWFHKHVSTVHLGFLLACYLWFGYYSHCTWKKIILYRLKSNIYWSSL